VSITIDATVGGPSANSFADEPTAIAFAATRLNLTGWVTVSGSTCTNSEKQALVEATRELSALLYQGYRASDAQALSWPRYLALNPDMAGGASYYDPSVLPPRIINATCELAIAFLAAGTTDIAAADPSITVIRKRVDVLETEYAPVSQRAQGLARFPRVMRLIAPLLMIGSGQVRLTR
jgi:hypothetical protein